MTKPATNVGLASDQGVGVALCTLVVLILAEFTLLAGAGGVDAVVGRLGDWVGGLEAFAFVVAVLGFAPLDRLS